MLSRFWVVLADCNCDEEMLVIVAVVGTMVVVAVEELR